jgi:hypothetical protein
LLPPKKEDHIFAKMKQPSMFGKKTAIQNKKEASEEEEEEEEDDDEKRP